MSKKDLKAKKMGRNVSNPELLDVHRSLPKAEGGTYEDSNYAVISPVEHMKEHGNWREREEALDAIKTAMDDRRQVMKTLMKLNNQLLAYQRMTDVPNPSTVSWMEEQIDGVKGKLKECDKVVKKLVNAYAKLDVLTKAVLGIKGCAYITAAHMLAYVDLAKARHASSLWSYAGLHTASHARYEKGTTSGGNKTLRTALYNFAESQMKVNGPYREIYDRVKGRLEQSEKVTRSRNTKGELVDCAWKDVKPCHRHGAALRAVMKHFLADYWFVGRELLGLDNGPCYAEAQLGGNHRTVDPKERGWVW